MKEVRLPFYTLILSVFLAVLVSFSSVMCLNDAFALEAAPVPLLAVCTTAAVLSALASMPRRSWPFGLLAAVAVLAVILLQKDRFFDSLQTFVHAISSNYAQAFSSVRVVGEPAGDPIWVLLLLAVFLAWLTAWMSSWEGSVVLILLAVLPVLVLVLLVVDLAPVLWLIILTGSLLIFVLSHSVRQRSAAAGSLLAWWLVLPTIILLCAITVLWPPADYVRPDWSETLRAMTKTTEQVTQRVETWSQALPVSQSRWNRELQTVNLRVLGPKAMTGEPALDYRAETEISHLRGVSLGVYEDNTWKALPSAAYHAQGLSETPLLSGTGSASLLEIQTVRRESQLYTAYYLSELPSYSEPVDDAYLQNTDRLLAYESTYASALRAPSTVYDRYAADFYTQIPDELAEPLTAILEENGLSDAAPQDIARFLRETAVYDLNTPRVPSGEDFVLYFLTESRRGYCVHFASAAVLLLRTAGYPARYVTGYAVQGPAGEWNSVTEDDSHAWAEYYVNGIGWQPLDPTPADERSASADTQEPDQPDQPPAASDPAPQPNVPTPAEPGPGLPGNANEPSTEPTPWLWLLVIPGLVLLAVLRRWIAIRYRRHRCQKGHPNRRALTCWRWLIQLSKADRRPIDEALLCLAEKARFSQHTMTEDEIRLLDQEIGKRIQALRTGPVRKRLWWKFGKNLF